MIYELSATKEATNEKWGREKNGHFVVNVNAVSFFYVMTIVICSRRRFAATFNCWSRKPDNIKWIHNTAPHPPANGRYRYRKRKSCGKIEQSYQISQQNCTVLVTTIQKCIQWHSYCCHLPLSNQPSDYSKH